MLLKVDPKLGAQNNNFIDLIYFKSLELVEIIFGTKIENKMYRNLSES